MNCDKCGREVPINNDASLVEGYIDGQASMILYSQPRHFLPVIENGVVVCEGSPSRAQYIEGQPKDKRGYGYNKEREKKIREAYKKLLKQYPES